MKIWIRDESQVDEYRTPLIPGDMQQLVSKGCDITIESSQKRCFSDDEYRNIGAKIVDCDFSTASSDTIILGLKELPPKRAYYHKHIYFSHSFKSQKGSKALLEKFRIGGGEILDLEYLVDDGNNRVISFSYDAGRCAAALALILYTEIQSDRKEFTCIQTYSDFSTLNSKINCVLNKTKDKPRLLILGVNGKCGRGACEYLSNLGIEFRGWDRDDLNGRSDCRSYINANDILINCIATNKEERVVILDRDSIKPDGTLKLIIDLTCEPGNNLNPLPLYEACNTFENPVQSINLGTKELYLSAINNIASMVPRETSRNLSRSLSPLLFALNDNGYQEGCWANAKNLYLNRCK